MWRGIEEKTSAHSYKQKCAQTCRERGGVVCSRTRTFCYVPEVLYWIRRQCRSRPLPSSWLLPNHPSIPRAISCQNLRIFEGQCSPPLDGLQGLPRRSQTRPGVTWRIWKWNSCGLNACVQTRRKRGLQFPRATSHLQFIHGVCSFPPLPHSSHARSARNLTGFSRVIF